MEVIKIEDYGVVPVPPRQGDYTPDALGVPLRSDLKTLEITQPEGPSFSVSGHEVRWQKWRMRLGFSPREGLILYDIGYEDQGRVRPILYRAALSEMVVPYGDTSPSHARQNAFDVGEYGVGWLANGLELGCDCLGNIYYFDAHMTNNDGTLFTIPNAVCMHEEDYGILWKHTNFRTSHVEVRRSRRLVISFIATVGIYEYGFFWYFYQDGSIQLEIKLTGIMNIAAIKPGEQTKYGKMLNEQLYAPIHQHFFCIRLDPMIDGPKNSVVEEHTEAVPMGEENPYGNAFYVKTTPLRTELEAQQSIDPLAARTWKIINPNVVNPLTGEPVGYQLMPGNNILPFADPRSSFLKRAGFTKHHLWVTPYSPAERYPAGEYPNQHPGGAGLPEWTRANRSIENTSLVVWYNVGVHHAARVEDWPVMPPVSCCAPTASSSAAPPWTCHRLPITVKAASASNRGERKRRGTYRYFPGNCCRYLLGFCRYYRDVCLAAARHLHHYHDLPAGKRRHAHPVRPALLHAALAFARAASVAGERAYWPAFRRDGRDWLFLALSRFRAWPCRHCQSRRRG
jgi:primary-amine oxidase